MARRLRPREDDPRTTRRRRRAAAALGRFEPLEGRALLSATAADPSIPYDNQPAVRAPVPATPPDSHPASTADFLGNPAASPPPDRGAWAYRPATVDAPVIGTSAPAAPGPVQIGLFLRVAAAARSTDPGLPDASGTPPTDVIKATRFEATASNSPAGSDPNPGGGPRGPIYLDFKAGFDPGAATPRFRPFERLQLNFQATGEDSGRLLSSTQDVPGYEGGGILSLLDASPIGEWAGRESSPLLLVEEAGNEREAHPRDDHGFGVRIAGASAFDPFASDSTTGEGRDGNGLPIAADLPELTAMALSILDGLMGRPAALALSTSGEVEEVEPLLPIVDSSLALAATLATVPLDPAADPGDAVPPVSAPATANDLAAVPRWARFVSGMDEAFEQTRRATRDEALAAADALDAGSDPPAVDGVAAAPSPDLGRSIEPEPDPIMAVDDATPATAREEAQDDATASASAEAAVAASASLLLVPAWFGGRLTWPRLRRRAKRRPGRPSP